MGTRHLICVFMGGIEVVAQYGQWDGYPSGQGKTILAFLRNKGFNVDKFKKQIKMVSFGTQEEIQKEWAECGASANTDWVDMPTADKHKKKYPQNSRDTGADILQIIYDTTEPLKLVDSIDFATDSLFCEWAYVIDLDKLTFEVYKGFNTHRVPKIQRFAYLNKSAEKESHLGDKKYYPVALVNIYPLAKLPTEKRFLHECEGK